MVEYRWPPLWPLHLLLVRFFLFFFLAFFAFSLFRLFSILSLRLTCFVGSAQTANIPPISDFVAGVGTFIIAWTNDTYGSIISQSYSFIYLPLLLDTASQSILGPANSTDLYFTFSPPVTFAISATVDGLVKLNITETKARIYTSSIYFKGSVTSPDSFTISPGNHDRELEYG